MKPKPQRAIEILTRLEAGAIDASTAAGLLGVSPRQVRRLRARFRQDKFEAVVHGNTGRTSANRTDPAVVERILALAGPGGKYEDLNICHLRELLGQEEQIVIGRSTLDRLLKAAGVRLKAKRARPIHRGRRPRRLAEGLLLQIDGSPFAWLEERGPKAVLLGAVDDATGKIVALLFRPSEDQVGYLLLLRAIAQRYGLPMSIYHDRHTILRSPKQPTLEDELAGQTPMSQIQRVLAELGIESIPAYSAQAKGRIERLWGTLQDRLTKELRLAGIATLEAAAAWLPGFIERYNQRFAKLPEDPLDAWVPLPADFDTNPRSVAGAATTLPAVRRAWSARTTALAMRATDSNCYPMRKRPAWPTSGWPSTSCPKESSICISASGPSATNQSLFRNQGPLPPNRRLDQPSRPNPPRRPAAARGSMPSAKPATCVRNTT